MQIHREFNWNLTAASTARCEFDLQENWYNYCNLIKLGNEFTDVDKWGLHVEYSKKLFFKAKAKKISDDDTIDAKSGDNNGCGLLRPHVRCWKSFTSGQKLQWWDSWLVSDIWYVSAVN